MPAFNSMTCPRCKKRFGFAGELVDCPPCPGCKYQIPRIDLESDEAEMDKFRDFLTERKKSRDDK